MHDNIAHTHARQISAKLCSSVSLLILASPLSTRFQDKSNLSEEHLPGLEEIVGDEDIAKAVLKGARSSMGETHVTFLSSNMMREILPSTLLVSSDLLIPTLKYLLLDRFFFN